MNIFESILQVLILKWLVPCLNRQNELRSYSAKRQN